MIGRSSISQSIVLLGHLSLRAQSSVDLSAALKATFLFLGYYSKISGGHMPNELDSDYLIVSGSAGNETYLCPNTQEYIDADSDFIWFNTDGTNRDVSTGELIGYDLLRTPIKYDDQEPNTIRIIAILRANQVLNTEYQNKMDKAFHLPMFRYGSLSDFGYLKSNRFEQNLWTIESPILPISLEINPTLSHSVLITFPENMNESSIPDPSCFSIVGKTPSAVTISNNVVTVTFTIGFDLGNIVNISYNVPRTNRLKNVSGVCIATFNELSVTNNITSPLIIYDGNTVAWYLSDDLTTITKDGGNLVARWNDKLGSGHDLIQATGTKQPLWSANGILFDGIDNVMKTANFTFNQPEFIYIVFKQVSWTGGDSIFDGSTSDRGCLRQTPTTPNLRALVVEFSPQASLVVGTYAIVKVLFNGAASKIQVNAGTVYTWDCGVNNMGGFCLGARGQADYGYSNIEVKEIILRKVSDISTNELVLYNYLKTKYSL